jgi:hypothetical protein
MIEATGQTMGDHHRNVTQQEFFVLVGLLLLAAMFSTFAMATLFRAEAWQFPSFLSLPDFSSFMTYDRFKRLLRKIDFALKPTDGEAHGCFWKVQPLVDAFNENRQTGFQAGWKLVVDESMSAWKGHDQRHGAVGCPHVTKIVRKPKGVGMEIKNLCDVDSNVMLKLEIVADKKEMSERDYSAALGAGTALLLRLTKEYSGTGRVVIADSAFASVKSAVELKKKHGLDFIGLVKTASRKFPKQYFTDLDMKVRGDHVVLVAMEDDVNLMAVSWNEGKKDKTTEKIVKKNIISTCGTTLAGQAHKKRRWQVHEDGTISKVTIDIKRPRVTEEYFTGAQAIDVHNHYRQGTLALEARRTNRWDWRFFQTFLGIVEVDAYVAYKRFCPGKQDVTHNQFLLSVIDYLLNNKIGVPDTAPVLRPRAARAQAEQAEAVVGMHDLQALETAAYFAEKKRGVLTCRVCKMKCYWYCATCSSDATCAKGLAALCGPGTGRDCFVTHQTQNPVSTAAGSSK